MALGPGQALTRQHFQEMILPQDVEAYRQKYQFNPGIAPQGGFDGEGNWTGFGPSAERNDATAKKMLALFDQYGANSATDLPPEVRQQLPNGGVYKSDWRGLWRHLGDFVTSPPFLLIAGGVGAMYAAPAAAAGAGSAAGGSGAAGTVAGAGGELAAGGAAAYGGGTAAGTAGGAAATGTSGTASMPAAVAPSSAGYTASPFVSASGSPATIYTLSNTSAAAGGAGAAGGAMASGGGGSSTGAATGTTATTEAAKRTALENILNGSGTSADYLTVFGQIAPSLLGMYASDRQADKLGDLAARYEGYGAPYRGKLAELYSDPTAFLNSPEVKVPVQMGTDALARSLSTQGNPAGSGSALHALQDYATNQYWNRIGAEKDRLGGFGGLTQYASAAPQIATGAIGAERGVYDALGYGIGATTNPPRSLEDMLKQYNISQGLQ